jgi:hypothetical protein
VRDFSPAMTASVKTRPNADVRVESDLASIADVGRAPRHVAEVQIVLQKSKVAGLQIFRENTKWEAIVDSYNLIRVSEVAYEFNTRR